MSSNSEKLRGLKRRMADMISNIFKKKKADENREQDKDMTENKRADEQPTKEDIPSEQDDSSSCDSWATAVDEEPVASAEGRFSVKGEEPEEYFTSWDELDHEEAEQERYVTYLST